MLENVKFGEKMLKIKFDDAAKSRKLRPTRTKKNDAGDA